MDAELSRAAEADRHGWNSLENYQEVHERRIEHHPLVDHSRPNTVAFDFFEVEVDVFVRVEGEVFCHHDIVVEVTKWLETRWTRDGWLQVRAFSYRYNARIAGRHNLLRYDNAHDFDEYHVHRYDLQTGNLIERRSLTRNEFPLLSEVLDELHDMFQPHS